MLSIIQKRWVMLCLFVMMCIFGYYSWKQLSIEAYPDIADVTSQVVTQVPGLAAEDHGRRPDQRRPARRRRAGRRRRRAGPFPCPRLRLGRRDRPDARRGAHRFRFRMRAAR